MIDLIHIAESIATSLKRSASYVLKAVWSPAKLAAEFNASANQDDFRDAMLVAVLIAAIGGATILCILSPGSYTSKDDAVLIDPRAIITACLILVFSVGTHAIGSHLSAKALGGVGRLLDTALFFGLVAVGLNVFTAPLIRFQRILPSPQFDWVFFVVLGCAIPIFCRSYICWIRATYSISTRKAAGAVCLAMTVLATLWGLVFMFLGPHSAALQRFGDSVLSEAKSEAFEIHDCLKLAIPIGDHKLLRERRLVADAFDLHASQSLRVTLAEAATCLERLKLYRDETKPLYAAAKLLVEQTKTTTDVYDAHFRGSSVDDLRELQASDDARDGIIDAYITAFLMALDAGTETPAEECVPVDAFHLKLSEPKLNYSGATDSGSAAE